MATVFKAKQLSLDRTVAIKVLPRKLSENVKYVEMFYREGKAAAKLNHPNIVQAFDVGETFSGVDYDTGLDAVEELRALLPEGATMAQFALRWILMFDAVSCAIPGAKNVEQATANAQAAALPPLSDEVMAKIKAIYDDNIRPLVHHRW